jgi:hypothetical protein
LIRIFASMAFAGEGSPMQRGFLALIVIFASSALMVCAQEPLRAPDGGTSYHVSGVDLLAIPDKPFSARSRTDWTRILEDGSTVKVYLEANLARDTQGRMYRERVSFVPEGSNQKSRLNEIMLFDPQAQTRTTCSVSSHHCSITSYIPRTSFVPQPVGAFANGTRSLARENLGTDVMEDLNVVRTRETLTINAGTMGNERPLVTTREFWYSPEIETNILTIRKDPREGTQVVRLSAISRSEPDAKMFQVPEGYTVQDDRSSGAAVQPSN